MAYIKATEAAALIQAGWDLTLSNRQYRRVAKRLHKYGIGITADYRTYYVDDTQNNISFI